MTVVNSDWTTFTYWFQYLAIPASQFVCPTFGSEPKVGAFLNACELTVSASTWLPCDCFTVTALAGTISKFFVLLLVACAVAVA